MQTKTISHILIALSIFGNIYCAYIQRPMKLTRRIKPKNKIQKEDSGHVQSGWAKLHHVSYEPYTEIPYSSTHIHGGWEAEGYYDHNSHPQMLQAVSNLNEEVNKFTNEFLGVMGPLLFPLPFFLAMLPFALPAIPLAIYLDTLGEHHNDHHNNPNTPNNVHNNTNPNNPNHPNHPHDNPIHNDPNNPTHNDPNNPHNNPHNNHTNPNNNPNNNNNGNSNNSNNPNGNNSGQMMGSQSGSGGNGSLQLPPFPISSPSPSAPFPGQENNPSFPNGPPFMMMNPSFPNSSGPSFPESSSVTNAPFPPFTTIGFNPPNNQPGNVGGNPTDTGTETSFNMSSSSLDPDLLPPINFPNGMIDATQSTPFSLFQFPIFLNSSYLDVTEK